MKFKKTSVGVFTYSMMLCLQPANGAEIPKLPNTTAINLPASWSTGVVPGPTDVGLWNNLITATVNNTANLPTLGADLSLGGIKVTSVGGTRNLGTNYIGYFSPSPSKTLTIGAPGFDLSTATQSFFVASKITLAANQTWNIGDANSNANPAGFNNNEDLGFLAQTLGDPFNFGGNKVTTTGPGQVTISSG
jgi:hypothetical protein